MGTTLGISHNVFDKVKVEKDRKERLKDYDDWQKEKARKIKALAEFQASLRNMRQSRAEDKIVTESSIVSNTSVGDEENKDDKADTKTGARRKTSRPHNRSSIKKSSHKDSISSTCSLTDEKISQKLNSKRSSGLNRMKEYAPDSSNIETQKSKRNSIDISQNNILQNKKKLTGWVLLQTNLRSASNADSSSYRSSEPKLLSSSSQRDLEEKGACMLAKEKETTTENISFESSDTGCGGRNCTIL